MPLPHSLQQSWRPVVLMTVFCTFGAASPATLGQVPSAHPANTYLRVDSQPSDTPLWVNGAFRGNTPLELTDLEPGEHLLSLSKPDYREHHHGIRMEPQQRQSLNVRLEPISGLVLVQSHPPGADVRIDGALQGRTPTLLSNLRVGRYRMTLSHSGYHEETLDLRIADRIPNLVSVELQSDSAMIEVRTTPVAAELSVNGVPRGATPQRVARIPEGEILIELTADGYQPVTRTLRLAAGDFQTLDIPLTPIPAALHIETTPPGARVTLDGRYRGLAPLALDNLPPGVHQLELTLAGHDTLTQTLRLGHGETQLKSFELTANTGQIVLTTEPAAVSVYIDGRPYGVTQIVPEGADPISLPLELDAVPVGAREMRLSRRGYYERTLPVQIERGQTLTLHQTLRRRFVPDYEVITDRRVYRGVLDSITAEFIRIETAPGVLTPVPTRDIRTHRPLREDEQQPVPLEEN